MQPRHNTSNPKILPAGVPEVNRRFVLSSLLPGAVAAASVAAIKPAQSAPVLSPAIQDAIGSYRVAGKAFMAAIASQTEAEDAPDAPKHPEWKVPREAWFELGSQTRFRSSNECREWFDDLLAKHRAHAEQISGMEWTEATAAVLATGRDPFMRRLEKWRDVAMRQLSAMEEAYAPMQRLEDIVYKTGSAAAAAFVTLIHTPCITLADVKAKATEVLGGVEYGHQVARDEIDDLLASLLSVEA